MPQAHRWRFVVLLTALAIFFGARGLAKASPRTADAPVGWTLAWTDEFNGSGAPSSANWNYHVGNGWNPGLPGFQGWGNNEWEWYRPEQCTQQGGNLVIRADWHTSPTNIGDRDWYQRSCRITTDTHHSFTYGRIEARIQMPNAAGSWPAFWMMGDACDDTSTNNYNAPMPYYDTMTSNWASCGEVDIMEHRNSDSTIVNNIFWDTRTGLFPWTAGQNANYVAFPNVGDVNTFHIYAIEWDHTFIRWFVDGVQTHVIDITPETLEEFHKPFHLILNLALGGQFPAQDPQQGQFPLTMSVDYVRYYTAAGGPLVSSTTRLSSSLNPSPSLQRVTLAAMVSPSSASGAVTFMDGSTTLGTGTLSGGTATYATSSLTVGTHSITASYGGDSAYSGSTSPTLTQTVKNARRRAVRRP